MMDSFPDDKRTKCQFLQKEEMQLGKQLLTSVKSVLDLFVKTVTAAVFLQHHAWLQSIVLQLDTRVLIEDLPFEGEGLFSNTTDRVFQVLDQSIRALRTLGVSASAKGSKSRPWPRSWPWYTYSRPSPEQLWRLRQQQSLRTAHPGKPKFQQQGQQ